MTSLGGYMYLYDLFDHELEHGKYYTKDGRKIIMDKWLGKHIEIANYFQFYPKVSNSILFASENRKARRVKLKQRINQATNHVKK